MPANDADIAKYTSDGVVITTTNRAVLAYDSNAIDGGISERVLFFDDAAAGQIINDEAFSFLGRLGKLHEAIEVDDTLSLGVEHPIWPAAPGITIVDQVRGIDARAAIRAYSFDMSVDRYAIELVGLAGRPGVSVTIDSTKTRIDSTRVTIDADYRLNSEFTRSITADSTTTMIDTTSLTVDATQRQTIGAS